MIGVDGAVQAHLPVAASSTTEAALMTRGVEPALSLARRPERDGSIAVRLYHKPLVLLIWLGAVVMVLGGALSLSDRRLAGRRAEAGARPSRSLQPAE